MNISHRFGAFLGAFLYTMGLPFGMGIFAFFLLRRYEETIMKSLVVGTIFGALFVAGDVAQFIAYLEFR